MDFFIGIVVDLLSGTTRARFAAAEAFDSPPRNASARRWRLAALLFLLATAGLFLTAALLHTLAGRPLLGEIFGWTGIVCFELCVFSGLRYAVVNRPVGM